MLFGGPPTVLPEASRLVLHELGAGQRCDRCGGDYSWFPELPVGPVVVGLRDDDNGPLWCLPTEVPNRRLERCGDGPPWPPPVRMHTMTLDDGRLVVLGYELVTR